MPLEKNIKYLMTNSKCQILSKQNTLKLEIGNWKLEIPRQGEAGFTLIEMVVVIGVIAILSTLLITIVNPFAQFQKARDTQRKSDLALVQKALEQYYQDFGKYPLSNGSFQIVGLNSTAILWGHSDTNDWPYLDVMPKDPDPKRQYVYYSTGQTYWLYGSLERGGNDPQACNKGNACTSLGGSGKPVSTSCNTSGTGNICNFGVSSPNTAP